MNEPSIPRRQFLGSAAGLGLGYSVCVHAQTPAAPTPARDVQEIQRTLDTLSQPRDLDARLAGETHMRLVDLDCDFLVAGGGMAGVCSAIAAARNGARVILVQDRSRLGGNASSEIRMHIVGADHHGNRPGWREGGILEELRIENAVRNPHSNWEIWDLLLYDKVISETNIRLLLDSALYAAERENGRIRSVLVRSDKTEHIYRITAPFYADCTGDCRLALEAGAQLRSGHEGRDAFGESLAPETAGPGTLGSSILFTSKEYWEPVSFTPPAWARKVRREDLEFRRIRSWEYGYWWIEWGGEHDAIHDNERIRFELLSIVLGVWDYIKNSGEFPESANWAMDWIGMLPGKRASRRIEGPHILTQDDLMGKTGEFQDAVAIGGWPFDDHPPPGFDDALQKPSTAVLIDDVYSIPLRSLFSANVHNLFMAGRNISASHVAFTSSRVMGTCSAVGQAVGTAAAFCHRQGLLPRDLVANPHQLESFRQNLLRDDQAIKDLANTDPLDLARTASMTASGAVHGSRPANVIDGWVRDTPGAWEHRWADLITEAGAWIELTWDTPQEIEHIQLTFDTGFERELTLSESRDRYKHMVVAAQPETARNYALLYRSDPSGDLRELLRVEGNYLRLRRHNFEPVRIRALRLHITASNGAPEARLYEIRCYARKPE